MDTAGHRRSRARDDRATPPAPLLVFMLAALAAAAAMLACVPPAPAAAASQPASSAAAKRAPYPPARLWYRVELAFEGTMSGQSNGDDGTVHFRHEQAWRVRSEHAVRISLMCVNRRLSPEPFFVKERVRRQGKRRRARVGGCGSRRSANLVPTARFSAAARGEATAYTITNDYEIFACEPFSGEHLMTAPQPLDGTILTASSATEGLRHSSRPSTAGRAAAPISVFQESAACRHPDGTPYEHPGDESERHFGPTEHLGAESVIDRRQIAESMRFRIPPRRFGKPLTRRFGPIGQSFDLSRPGDNGAGAWHYAAKRYEYTLKLTPCPRRGRAVGRC